MDLQCHLGHPGAIFNPSPSNPTSSNPSPTATPTPPTPTHPSPTHSPPSPQPHPTTPTPRRTRHRGPADLERSRQRAVRHRTAVTHTAQSIPTFGGSFLKVNEPAARAVSVSAEQLSDSECTRTPDPVPPSHHRLPPRPEHLGPPSSPSTYLEPGIPAPEDHRHRLEPDN